MYFHGTFLVRDENTLYEEDLDGDPSGKWTRTVSHYFLVVRDLEILFSLQQGELSYQGSDNLRTGIRASTRLQTKFRIKGFAVPRDGEHDLTWAQKAEGEGRLQAVGIREPMLVEFFAGTPIEKETDCSVTGIFRGSVFELTDKSANGEPNLYWAIPLPEDQLIQLVERIESNRIDVLDVTLLAPSFTSEMYSFLSDGTYPLQHVFGPNQTPVFPGEITCRKEQERPPSEAAFVLGDESTIIEVDSEIAATFPTPLTASTDYSSLLRSIRAALWTLVVVAIVSVLR